MPLRLITAPAAEPVTLQEAKDSLRVDGIDEDVRITRHIINARRQAEAYTERQLVTATWELVLDAFPPVIRLPRPPLQSVESITYIDDAGVVQTLDPGVYKVLAGEPARIVPAYNQAWPSVLPEPDAVVIRFVAGYGDPAAVPEDIKDWMLIQIGTLYEHREGVVVGQAPAAMPFVDNLLAFYKVWGI